MGECFPKSESKLPQLLNYFQEQTGYEEIFRAIDGTENFLIFGGSSTSALMNTGSQATSSIIVRMNLGSYTRKWAKAVQRINGQSTDIDSVEAIAVKASLKDQVAIFARDSRSKKFENGAYRGYLFVLYCADGSLVHKMLRITQSD